jgi:integrase
MLKRTPKYCLHKATGQAVVRIDGRDHYLGKHGTPESEAEYQRLIGEWHANGQTLRRDTGDAAGPCGLTVAEMLLAYWHWAEGHYRDGDGRSGAELENMKLAVRPLRQRYGHTAAAAFGPNALRALQADLAKAGLCRTVVNYRINRIRRAFRWAVSRELVPAAVFEALRTVIALQRGRSRARESDPVAPAPAEHVQATLPHLPAPVRAMVEVQQLTGCRPGEAMVMRALDLNTSGAVWIYRPHRHKNRHRGLERVIFLGPQAQAVIKPFLTTDLEAYLFSPRRYVEDLHARRAAARKTKRTPSELRRRRKAKPKRRPAECYDRRSYRQAIARACRKAGVPAWSPLQLRHTAATLIRARYGLEAAKVVLGHTKVETSQLYAERDLHKAQQIMAEIG